MIFVFEMCTMGLCLSEDVSESGCVCVLRLRGSGETEQCAVSV
jgi:hypothetical protein